MEKNRVDPIFRGGNTLSRAELGKGKNHGIDARDGLIMKERNFMGRILKSDEIEKAYKLRYKIFHEELKWLPLNTEKGDIDKYDKYSIHFGVFNPEKLVTCSRIILPKGNFMIEEVFKDLIPKNYTLRRGKDTVEISRLLIDQPFRYTNDSEIIKMLLFKTIYHWSLKNRIRFWYMSIEVEYLKSIQKIFPCKQIGEIKFYQPGTASTVALLDLREAETFVAKTNPELYNWFTRI